MIVDGYVRVSHVGARRGLSFISPALQREKIEGWARLHDAHLDRVFDELDESGARQDRPMLMEAIERVEAGVSNGIVVAKLDRFGRSLRHGLVAIERITDAGGTLVSVADGFDFGTDTGRLVLKIMLSMAEWELDRIKQTWLDSQRKAVERGAYPYPAPVGYWRTSDGVLEPDQELGPAVTWLFAQRAEGLGYKRLADGLSRRGVTTAKGGKAWSAEVVRHILARRTYLGEAVVAGKVHKGNHAALTDPATWARAQRPDAERPRKPTLVSPTLLRGMVRCASCGRVMGSAAIGSRKRAYTCPRRSSAGVCPVPATIAAKKLESHVEAVFWQLVSSTAKRGRPSRLRELENLAAQRELELTSYRDNTRLERTLGPNRFTAGVAVRVERLDAALVAVAQARREESAERPDPQELGVTWPAMTPHERNEVIRTVVDCAFVRPRYSRAPTTGDYKQILVFARGRAPAGMIPYGEHRITTMQPLSDVSARDAVAFRPASDRPWSEGRLSTELEAFLEHRTGWPDFDDFQRAGQALLWRQIDMQGGERVWAARFGHDLEPPRDRSRGWTDERIRRELDIFLEGRTEWPPTREFTAAGLDLIRHVVAAHGGPERWAREYGLPLHSAYRPRATTWTDERMEAELRPLVAGRTTWPPRANFDDAGLTGLYNAIQRRGTRNRWAAHFGLRPPAARIRPNTLWTDEVIEDQLGALVRELGRWPRHADFAAAGLRSVYEKLRREGTTLEWAERLGV